MTGALIKALGIPEVVGGFDRVLFGDYEDFHTLDPSIRLQVHLARDTLPAADFVSGHMAYSTLTQRFAAAQCMTVLREPISRILSHWLYWRGQSEEHLSLWGTWADRVRLARRPLAIFLSEPSIAAHSDNLVVRMLLWPHPLIPQNSFIEQRHRHELLAEARARLDRFKFLDVVENPLLAARLEAWLGRPFALGRLNETPPVRKELVRPLSEELTEEAFGLLTERSWLDLQLWTDLARHLLPGRDIGDTREAILLRNVARFSALMSA
jgi:hypothetical protein